MEDHSFPARVRIKSRLDFDRAFREGVVVADGVLVLHVIYRTHGPMGSAVADTDLSDANPSIAFPPDRRSRASLKNHARLGLSVSKRFGNAPNRNRWKRLVREVFRKNRQSLPPIDIVARPKKGAVADYQAICTSFPNLISRALRKLAHNQN